MNTRHSATAAAVAPSAGVERRKPGWLERFTDHFQRYWQLWVLSAPALVFVAIFAYVPMWGIQLAFRKFDSAKGLTGGEWVGLHYFEQSFTSPLFGEILWNTFRISLWTLVTGFIFPIILALLINQIGSSKIKGFVQTVTYMPHFISTVVIVSMLNIFLDPNNGFIGKLFGDESLLGSTTAITAVYWISEVWQHRGWNCIIYLAALSSVDPSLYEAAKIDGAGRFQLIRYVDFPAILPTAGVLLILQMGSVLNVGYTQLDLFVQRAEQDHAPTIRLHADGECVAERVMDADLYRQRFQIDLDPQERYTLEVVDATVSYLYLTGGEDLLDRGIRVLDAATGDPMAGDGAPETTDPTRAAVHFEPPEHWMNDPNGLCRFQGRYHLYYQFNPYGWGWDNMHWGHAASRDLVHWTYLPVILEPQRELHTRRGIAGGAFSGSAITIDAEGRPCPGDDAAAIRFYLTRHFEVPGQPDTVEECQTTCVSTDSLTAGPETVVVRREGADFGRDFRDAKIETGFGGAIMAVATNLPSDQVPASGEPGASDANEGGWFTLSPHGKPDIDHPDPNRIPAIVTFRNDTPNLADDAWTYVGPMVADRGYAEGRTYECPDAFPLDGADVAIGAMLAYDERENGGFSVSGDTSCKVCSLRR